MSTKDGKSKEYMADNARFADLCNYVLYDGKTVIKPENLEERDTTEVLSVFGIDKKQIVEQKWRDLLKRVEIRYTGNAYIVLMGIESQSHIHYAMPVKNMIYDALCYGKQVNEAKRKHDRLNDYDTSDDFMSGFDKEDRLTPVVTITLYLGTKKWDGPRCLKDMLADTDEAVLSYVSDYNINLVDPREIQDFSKFKTELKQLLEVLQSTSDKTKMHDILQQDPAFKQLDKETVAAINMFAGTNMKIDEKAKVIDMCKAWEDAITEGKEAGKIEGRIEGKIVGKAEGIIKMGKKYNLSKEKILIDLQEELEISDSQAQEYYDQYTENALA